MKTVVLLPNFGLQAAKLKIFNLEWVIFQEIQTIPIWIKLTKFDDIIQKYNGVIKNNFSTNSPPYHELTPQQISSQ